jgi:hypothetical protein
MPLQQSSEFFPIHGGDVQRRHAINIFTRDPKHFYCAEGCVTLTRINPFLPTSRAPR